MDLTFHPNQATVDHLNTKLINLQKAKPLHYDQIMSKSFCKVLQTPNEILLKISLLQWTSLQSPFSYNLFFVPNHKNKTSILFKEVPELYL